MKIRQLPGTTPTSIESEGGQRPILKTDLDFDRIPPPWRGRIYQTASIVALEIA